MLAAQVGKRLERARLRLEGDSDATVWLFDGGKARSIAPLLRFPAVAAIDLGCDDPVGGLSSLPARLLLRVATVHALRHDVAGPMVDELKRRLPRIAPIRATIHSALQEAVGNAVMHGNLALASALRQNRDGLTAMAQLMEHRTADPHYSRRPVTVAARWDLSYLVLTVEDRGHGFQHPPAPAAPLPHAASGRGLAHIRSVCSRVTFSAQGRRIAMRFRLP